MATLVGANFFVYFSATDNADRVNCKICGKSLMSNRRFNLKQHLKQTHKIQVCLNQNRVRHAALNYKKPKKIALVKEDVPSSSSKIYEYSSLENKSAENNSNNFYDINTQTLDSNDSRDSGSIANQVLPPDNFVEPKVKSQTNKRGFSDPLNDSELLTKRQKLVLRLKKKQISNDDPLEENISSSNDHFEKWAKKKIQLLEIELLEMRNYKFKLELYEMEQQLRLSCSKFTRDIRGLTTGSS